MGPTNEAAAADWQSRATRVAAGIRRRGLELAVRRNGGYLSQACSAAELLSVLYVHAMKLGPVGPGARNLDGDLSIGRSIWGGEWNGANDPKRDRFVLSAAHYASALYATLCEVGRLPENLLRAYAEDGSALEMIGGERSPGIETTSGSLGQALSVGIGRSLARRAAGAPGRIWVLMSDGELQEGQTWEAFQVASHYRLGNVTVVLDANGLQVDGPTSTVIDVEPIAAKVRAFGWSVAEVDGHDLDAIATALDQRPRDRPHLVVARTNPWQGMPSLRPRFPNSLHFIRFRSGEAEAAWADLEIAGAAG